MVYKCMCFLGKYKFNVVRIKEYLGRSHAMSHSRVDWILERAATDMDFVGSDRNSRDTSSDDQLEREYEGHHVYTTPKLDMSSVDRSVSSISAVPDSMEGKTCSPAVDVDMDSFGEKSDEIQSENGDAK